MRKLTLSIGAAVLATAGVAVAAPQIAGHVQADMTRAQAQTMAAEHFAKMDANGDGKLDQSDRAARQAKMFDRIDADHNGAISRDEFAAMHGQRGQRGEGVRAGRHGMGGADMPRARMGGHRGDHGGHGGFVVDQQDASGFGLGHGFISCPVRDAPASAPRRVRSAQLV